jgi:hypothetical protein
MLNYKIMIQRSIVILLLAFTLIACDSKETSDTSPIPFTPDYTNPTSYPVTETAVFSSHTVGDIFKLSDNSAWQIVGSSKSTSYHYVSTNSNVTIYQSSSTTPDPVAGSRSNYYLIGTNVKPAFYITPIPMALNQTGTVAFRSHTVDDVFSLPDGSAWKIVGSSQSTSYHYVPTTDNVTVYQSSSTTPDPVAGSRSNYYLIGTINVAYFITPI